MRSTYFTYVNDGATYSFRVDKMTRHPYKARGATQLQVHALLTLDGKDDGRPMEVMNSRGQPLNHEQLVFAARTGKVMDNRKSA